MLLSQPVLYERGWVLLARGGHLSMLFLRISAAPAPRTCHLPCCLLSCTRKGFSERDDARADKKADCVFAAGVRDPARCCEYRLLANNHNVEPALHHRKVEIILELHGH
jgi:hypothetical protein